MKEINQHAYPLPCKSRELGLLPWALKRCSELQIQLRELTLPSNPPHVLRTYRSTVVKFVIISLILLQRDFFLLLSWFCFAGVVSRLRRGHPDRLELKRVPVVPISYCWSSQGIDSMCLIAVTPLSRSSRSFHDCNCSLLPKMNTRLVSAVSEQHT
jgi:hypothetical protein